MSGKISNFINTNLLLWSKNRVLICCDFILVFFAVSCTLGLVISGFRFDVQPVILFLVYFVVSFLAVFLAYYRRIKGLLFILASVVFLIIFWLRDLIAAAQLVLFNITNDFRTMFYLPLLFEGAEASMAEQTLFFAVAGIFLSFPLSFAICIRRSLLLTVIFTIPVAPLIFAHVYISYNPLFLAGLLFVYFMLLFSSAIESSNGKASLFSMIPARVAAIVLSIILLGGAMIIAPQHNFSRNRFIMSLDHHVRGFATEIGLIRMRSGIGWPFGGDGEFRFSVNDVGISGAGARELFDVSLLEVSSGGPGLFYLKGYSMQHFDGNSWSVNSRDLSLPQSQWVERLPAQIAWAYSSEFPGQSVIAVRMIINRTGDITENVEYIPYHTLFISLDGTPTDSSFLHSTRSIPVLYERLYLYSNEPPMFDLSEYSALVHSPDTYLQINESTAQKLRQIAFDAGIDLSSERLEIASSVAQFFSTFGQYTLAPLPAPADEDFTLYFLEHSKHGYCIHYATSATLMLRAMGVPARFTVGYVAQISPEDILSRVELTDANAHAWVEVFFDEFGWLPLEVTPPADTAYTTFFGSPQAGTSNIREQDIVEDWFGIDPGDPWLDYQDDWGSSLISDDALEYGELSSPVNRQVILGLLPVLLVLSMFLRRSIILSTRKKRFTQANTNQAVLYAWDYLSRLAGSKQDLISKTVKELALKACFSQHRLTENERILVVEYCKVFSDEIYRQRSFLRRIFMRVILAL